VGDRILTETAHILRRAFRKNDVLARIGGDEFAALLPPHATATRWPAS
jgi:diguanylate cyclase (GGDEF)-like protein